LRLSLPTTVLINLENRTVLMLFPCF